MFLKTVLTQSAQSDKHLDTLVILIYEWRLTGAIGPTVSLILTPFNTDDNGRVKINMCGAVCDN